jgi:hypothetical protein
MADTSPNESTSGGLWSQRGFVAAAAFLGIVIVAAVGILLINPGEGSDSDRATPPQSGNNDKPGASTDPAASVCGLKAGSQEIPQTPPEAEWELVGTIAAPKTAAVGPGIDKGKRRLCFAHSPTGALFAAVNFIAVAAIANNDDELMRELTASTKVRDELLAQGDAASGSDPALRMQVAGFRIVGASAKEATVELVFSAATSGQQGFVGMALPMRWERGDWKVVIASATEPYAAQRLDSASGYVRWSGA